MSFDVISPFLCPIAYLSQDPDVSEIMVNDGVCEETVMRAYLARQVQHTRPGSAVRLRRARIDGWTLKAKSSQSRSRRLTAHHRSVLAGVKARRKRRPASGLRP